MKKFFTLLLFVVLGFTLVACGSTEHTHTFSAEWSNDINNHWHAATCEHSSEVSAKGSHAWNAGTVTKEPTEEAEGEKTFTCTVCGYNRVDKIAAIVVDEREADYVVYEADGELIEQFKSLYAAIVYCVDNCDIDAYVVHKEDTEAKLFINADKFSVETKDMYWHYTKGTEKYAYTPWIGTYWTDAKDTDHIVIFKEASSGQIQPYANGWKLVSVSEVLEDAKNTNVWNACWKLEANATVNLEAYSGITKGVYDIKLSESRVYPTYEETEDSTYAYVGFITADAYNVSNQGLRCDTSTGNWYYYAGETGHNKNDIELDDSNILLTSTWDNAAKCWRPNADLKLTMELLTLTDDEGDSYIVHRLTMELSNGQTYVRDYEIAVLSQCGTIRFTCGLDIETDNTFPDYMNGSKFENVVVTSAKGTVYQEMIDSSELYGNTTTLYIAGEYDLLNSNPASDARYHTMIYTPACVSYDFSTPGKDVYSFSYDFLD